MTLKETLVADLKATLEETSNIMADRVILESLAKNGSISLDEAEFYDSLVRRVVTEAAEEFVPESLNMPVLEEMGMPAGAPGEAMVLTGEDGTVYNFDPATCELTPVEGAEGAEGAEAPEAPAAPEGNPFAESTEVEATEEVLEEATEATEATEALEESEVQELTESQLIVSNLIKSLGV